MRARIPASQTLGAMVIASLLAMSTPIHAATFLINNSGDTADADPSAGNPQCDVGDGTCTLRAALMQGENLVGPHTITFAPAVTSITLTATLPTVRAPFVIDGTNAVAPGGHVEVNGTWNGSSGYGCFDLASSGTTNADGAQGSSISNLVINRCSGHGIAAVGRPYFFLNNFIGTDALGTLARQNNGDGINLTGTMPDNSGLLGAWQQLQSAVPMLPENDSQISNYANQFSNALNAVAKPVVIAGNLVSGNKESGIEFFSQWVANVIVSGNRIGISQTGLYAIANDVGLDFNGSAYGNFIGPGNVISGNTKEGIKAMSGAVLLPNFIMGNVVGPQALPVQLPGPVIHIGNGGSGIRVDTWPDDDGVGPDNPTGYSLFIGPLNVVADNLGTNAANLDAVSGDLEGGIVLSGTSKNVKVLGNLVGLLDISGLGGNNLGDGIIVAGADHEIGGSSFVEANFVLGNEKHGILVKSATNTVIKGNFIGVLPNVGIFGNAGDGIYLYSTSGATIGGTGSLDDNVIAGNGRNGIKVYSGNSNQLIRNQIYGNGGGGIFGVGIDLDAIYDKADDPQGAQSILYSNFGLNQPEICTVPYQASAPTKCSAATAPAYAGGNTSLDWTVTSVVNVLQLQVEFFAVNGSSMDLSDATAMTYVATQTIATDASGYPVDTGSPGTALYCTGGRCTSQFPADLRGKSLVMTARNVTGSSTEATLTLNNTSEFSNPGPVAAPAQGTLQFSAPTYSVNEGGVSATITVTRTGGSSGAVSADYTTSNGTAVAGSDYTMASGTLNWPAGDASSKDITVAVTDDSLVENSETVLLALSNPTGGALLGAQSTATLSITDNEVAPAGGLLQFSAPSYSVTENGVSATITVTRAGGTTGTADVDYATSDGSAAAGSDYAATTGTLHWNDGDATSKSFSVPVTNDSAIEFSETINLTLSNPVNAAIGIQSTATLTIIDNDTAPVEGVLQFSAPTYSVNENGGTATITVTRTGGSSGAASINYATSNSTATLVGNDYSAASGTLNWAAADAASKTFTVTITSDGDIEGDETINLTLSGASGAQLGPQATALLTIIDDDVPVPGITVNPTSGLVTTEAGGTATFTVVLDSAPTADVTIAVSSGDTSEGTIAPATLTFTSGNWSAAQTVTVTGVNDATMDGNIAYTIQLDAAVSLDAGYNGIDPTDVAATNNDNDAAGITVNPTSGLVTTEAGGTATFTVVLNSQPTADVGVAISSSDTSEGTVSPSSVTFTSGNWNVAQTVTVSGADDVTADGDIAYTIVLAAATSADPGYNGVNPADVSATNNDNEVAGITVTPTSGLVTTEAAGTATFTIVLNTQPTADVSIAISSSDTSEGTASPSSVTFTAANWNVAQTVTATGVDDATADGNIAYTIVLAAATSADGGYNGLDATDVSATNNDNDVPGITVNPTSGLVTSEAGGTAMFGVVLNTQPSATVTVAVSSANGGEGTVAPASLSFTTANWNIAQTVTVTGVDDAVADGNVAYTVVLGAATSADGSYNGINPADVSVTNNDNDAAGITVMPTSGLVTTEAGGTANFTVVLNSQPTADVTVAIGTSDGTEGGPAPASVTFTSGNWNSAQTVTVTGADDSIPDGTIPYTIVLAPATSGDPAYAGLDAADVSVTNLDNEGAVTRNLAPKAKSDSYGFSANTGTQQVNAASGVLANDFDPDTPVANLTVSPIGALPAGLTLHGDGSFDFDTTGVAVGTYIFTYQVSDGAANDQAQVTLLVRSGTGNLPPKALNDTYHLTVGSSVTVAAGSGVLANDSDPDGGPQPLTASLLNGPIAGLALMPDGGFTYQAPSSPGIYTFTYAVSDGAASVQAHAILYVRGQPAHGAETLDARDDHYGFKQGTVTSTPVGHGVLGNDIDLDNGPSALTVTALTSPPANFTLHSDGSFDYDATGAPVGQASFDYQVTDGLNTAVATVFINVRGVTPVNGVPLAITDVYHTYVGATLTVPGASGVLANDSDQDGPAPLTASLAWGPAGLALNGNGDGGFTFQAGVDPGIANAVYTVTDGAATNQANIVIYVRGLSANQVPTAMADVYTVQVNQLLTVPAGSGLRANDTDPDTAASGLTVALIGDPVPGLTLAPDGSFSYQAGGTAGAINFAYTLSDGSNVAQGSATITVTAVPNLPPVANADSYSVTTGNTLTVSAPGVLGNDTDPDLDPVTVTTTVVNPVNGTLTLNANGGFSYQPNAGFVGSDSFVYAIGDGKGGSAQATVTINVTAVPTLPPTAASDQYTVQATGLLNVPAASGLLANDSDPDTPKSALTVSLVGPAVPGLTLNADGSFSYQAGSSATTVTFNYQVSDGTHNATAQVTIVVTAIAVPVLAPAALVLLTGLLGFAARRRLAA